MAKKAKKLKEDKKAKKTTSLKKPVTKKTKDNKSADKKVSKKATKKSKPETKKASKKVKPIAKKAIKAVNSKEKKEATKRVTKKASKEVKPVAKKKAVKSEKKAVKKPVEKKNSKQAVLTAPVKKNVEEEKQVNTSLQYDEVADLAMFDDEGDDYKARYHYYKHKYLDEVKKNSVLTKIAIILAAISILLSSFSVIMYFKSIKKTVDTNDDPTSEVIEDDKHKFKELDYKSIFNEFQALAYKKDDYKGQIIFESGIINEPVVQGADNNVYLRRDYTTYKYRDDGPVFIDYECDVNFDKNITLYGHNFPKYLDKDQTKMFTPLHKLSNQENYEANKYVYLVLENRVEMYEIACVYDVDILQDENGNQFLNHGEPKYYLSNFSKEEFEDYLNSVKQREKYDTNVTFTNDDRLLTLQTCYETNVNKLIVVGKMIDVLYY